MSCQSEIEIDPFTENFKFTAQQLKSADNKIAKNPKTPYNSIYYEGFDILKDQNRITLT